jgi:hypothetical protein
MGMVCPLTEWKEGWRRSERRKRNPLVHGLAEMNKGRGWRPVGRVVWEDPREGAVRRDVDSPTFTGASIVGGGESLLKRPQMLIHNLLKIKMKVVKLD